MLENLHIKNVALIEESDVTFGAGLNILTGETGAGKSMLIDSLQFALGGRVGKDFLRKGQSMAMVEALFVTKAKGFGGKLEENGIVPEEDGTVLISRTLNDGGKSVCRINGSTVTVGMLKELAADLIDIYGQHEHQSLLNPAKHIRLLDRFCGEGLEDAIRAYGESFERCKALDKEMLALMGDGEQREQRMEMLGFQKEEIERAALLHGEEESLLGQKKRLLHMEKLIRLVVESIELLYDGGEHLPSVCDQMGDALSKLKEAVGLDRELEIFATELVDCYARIEDGARNLKRYAQGLEEEPQELERIEERLQLIYNLKRKYGGSVEAVLECHKRISRELDFLANSEEKAAELTALREKEGRLLQEKAEKLTGLRQETATQVEGKIEEALKDMEMKHACFSVQITERVDWNQEGKDKIEFLISANAGEDLKPLAKIASGGEMSRVMLALKSVLVDADEIETFIFDEIDTGVSGRTAGKVGEKMSGIGKKRQILCITHLPQIAAMADNHFLIEKEFTSENTVTKVYPLEEEATVKEVARLMGGAEITETTLAAAKELRAQKWQ